MHPPSFYYAINKSTQKTPEPALRAADVLLKKWWDDSSPELDVEINLQTFPIDPWTMSKMFATVLVNCLASKRSGSRLSSSFKQALVFHI